MFMKKAQPYVTLVYGWRRKGDSNPRERELLLVFETSPFNRLGIPPAYCIIPNSKQNVILFL